MILSKRERYIVIAVLLGFAVLGLDQFALSPLLEKREKLKTDLDANRSQLIHDQQTRQSSSKIRGKWAEMLKAGVNADATTVERDITTSVGDWAKTAGLNLTNGPHPERTENLPGKKDFRMKTFRVTGTGNMRAVSYFIWRIQTAKLPLRITDMTLTTRKEGMDDLQLELGLSTVYLAPEPDKAAGKPEATMALLREERP